MFDGISGIGGSPKLPGNHWIGSATSSSRCEQIEPTFSPTVLKTHQQSRRISHTTRVSPLSAKSIGRLARPGMLAKLFNTQSAKAGRTNQVAKNTLSDEVLAETTISGPPLRSVRKVASKTLDENTSARGNPRPLKGRVSLSTQRPSSRFGALVNRRF